MSAIEPQAPDPTKRPRGSRVWWWVVAAFALQFAAWTAWLIIAAHQKIEEVPLATGSSRAAD